MDDDFDLADRAFGYAVDLSILRARDVLAFYCRSCASMHFMCPADEWEEGRRQGKYPESASVSAALRRTEADMRKDTDVIRRELESLRPVVVHYHEVNSTRHSTSTGHQATEGTASSSPPECARNVLDTETGTDPFPESLPTVAQAEGIFVPLPLLVVPHDEGAILTSHSSFAEQTLFSPVNSTNTLADADGSEHKAEPATTYPPVGDTPESAEEDDGLHFTPSRRKRTPCVTTTSRPDGLSRSDQAPNCTDTDPVPVSQTRPSVDPRDCSAPPSPTPGEAAVQAWSHDVQQAQGGSDPGTSSSHSSPSSQEDQ